MFLSTENPPRDPLSSSSSSSYNLLRLTTTSSSHELGQSQFSIRDYAYSNRKNNIKKSWPFSTKSLQLCSSHGVTDPLPPFQKFETTAGKQTVSHVHHQTIAETSKGVCSQSRIIKNGLFTSVSKSKVEIVVAATSNNKSNKKCGRGGGMVKSKEDGCGVLVTTASESKTCPICKAFSSASNTTLNAHIDQCLSVDSAMPPASNKPNKLKVTSVDSAVPPVSSKPNKPRVKPAVVSAGTLVSSSKPSKTRVNQCMSVDSVAPLVSSKLSKPRAKPLMKIKTLVDIYATAKRCTLEDLDKRNGTQWASVLSRTNRDKSDVSKKRKASPVGVGPVYIDAKGQKLRILTEFSDKKTTTTALREQQEDGSSEKKSLSQVSKENSKISRKRRIGKKHGKSIKLTNHKANALEIPGEGSSTGHRRIYNQRMLAKRGLVSKKLNALRDQPSDDDDDDDDEWSGEDRLVVRGTELSATGSSPLNKKKLRSQVSGQNKSILFESKRAHSRTSTVQMSEKEERSLAGAYSKKSLASVHEDKYPPGKNTYVSPRATIMRNLSPPFVANGWRLLSPPVELKRARFDLSEEEEDEETGKWESEMTQERELSDDDYVSGDDNNPSFSRYYDYDKDDDEETSEEEEDYTKRANLLDKTDDTGNETGTPPPSNETIASERAMYYSEEVVGDMMIYEQTACDEEEDVRFGSDVIRGKGSLFVEVDTIPIPGPPGSFLPSPRGMCFDENLGQTSSVVTSQFQSSMDQQLDRNSSESPVSAVSNFPAGRFNFPSSLDIPSMSFCVPSHHGTIPEAAEPMSVDKEAPWRFRNNGHEPCCCQRKDIISLNHEASHLLQRRAAASSSDHAFEQSPYMIQKEFDLHNSKFSSSAVVPPSPSNSVLRLMGKDLMVMNQGEADNKDEASRISLKPTPQFHDHPQPCAGTGLYFNTSLCLRNSFESSHQQRQTPVSQQQTQASPFRNSFDHVRHFSPS